MKEAENPLLDEEEEEKEKDEGLLGTASPLLDGGATLDDLLRPYELAENQVMSEHGNAASPCAEADRRLFVRSCVRVQANFLQDHLPSWPWRPGAQEEMDPASRAEKGRQSAEAFREWMGSDGTAEAAHWRALASTTSASTTSTSTGPSFTAEAAHWRLTGGRERRP